MEQELAGTRPFCLTNLGGPAVSPAIFPIKNLPVRNTDKTLDRGFPSPGPSHWMPRLDCEFDICWIETHVPEWEGGEKTQLRLRRFDADFEMRLWPKSCGFPLGRNTRPQGGGPDRKILVRPCLPEIRE